MGTRYYKSVQGLYKNSYFPSERDGEIQHDPDLNVERASLLMLLILKTEPTGCADRLEIGFIRKRETRDISKDIWPIHLK